MAGTSFRKYKDCTALAAVLLALIVLGIAACQPGSTPRAVALTAAAAVLPTGAAKLTGQFIFDDFAYDEKDEMRKNGWILRDAPGWPGIPGATWSADHITLEDDPERPGGKLVRMTASTDGTNAGTRQAQFCHARKYFEGTYASRVRFTDRTDAGGPMRDEVVETFYQIAPQNGNLDPQYSELDFEYLPAGGWGKKGSHLFVTSWETFQLEPWKAYNQSTPRKGSVDGWHTLVLQVHGGKVNYFIDGQRIASHGGKNYPRVPMAMSYNLWFIREGLAPAGEERVYSEWIDWVYYEANTLLSPEEVEARVRSLREKGVCFNDTVPPNDPPLESPCNF